MKLFPLIVVCIIGIGSANASVVEQISGSEIDWGREIITAWAECPIAPASEQPNQALARKNAETWAKAEAAANLLAALEQTAVTYEARGADVVLSRKIEGFVRGIEVLKTEKITGDDGSASVRVTIGTRMYGEGAPGTLMLREAMKPRPKKASFCIEMSDKPLEPAPEKQVGPFTSLIVDTRGCSIARALSPKIRRADGSEVWGTLPVTPDFAAETGIACYVTSMEAARKNGRCGSNPLVVKAVGRAGKLVMCDAVVSDADASLILDESVKTGFLDQCKVVFVIDAPATP